MNYELGQCSNYYSFYLPAHWLILLYYTRLFTSFPSSTDCPKHCYSSTSQIQCNMSRTFNPANLQHLLSIALFTSTNNSTSFTAANPKHLPTTPTISNTVYTGQNPFHIPNTVYCLQVPTNTIYYLQQIFPAQCSNSVYYPNSIHQF